MDKNVRENIEIYKTYALNNKNKLTSNIQISNIKTQTSNLGFPTSNTAITLVALVITIIVLLILAGITINMVVGENGIFAKATGAKNKTEVAQYEEELRMCVLELQADEVANGTTFNMETIKNKFEEKVKKIENTDDIEFPIAESETRLDGIYKGYEFYIDEKYVAHIGEKTTGIRILTNIEPTGWTKGPVKATITIKSNNGLAKIKPENEEEIDVGGKTEYVITKENIVQNTTFKYEVTDNQGTTTNKTIEIKNIDTNAPTKCEIEKTENTEEGLKITVNAEDEESGIEKIEYHVIDGDNKEEIYTTNVINNLSGTQYSIYVVAYDKAGNKKQTEKINVKVTRKYEDIEAGENATFAIDKKGDLWYSGFSSHGDPNGKGSLSSTQFTKMIEGKNLKEIKCGIRDDHFFALDNENNLYAWGHNAYGQIGNGIKNNANYEITEIKTDGKLFKEVANQDTLSRAIDEDGNIWVWGARTLGNGTNGTTGTPIKLNVNTTFKKISAGGTSTNAWNCTIAIDINGNLWSWGNNSWGQLGLEKSVKESLVPQEINTENTKFKEISAGEYHVLAIDESGNIWSWGDNSYTQLGRILEGTEKQSNVPTMLNTNGIKFSQVSAGEYQSLAIDIDGNLWSWGDNSRGQIGQEKNKKIAIPTKVETESAKGVKFKKISAGNNHSVALDEDGNIWACGDCGNGKLSNGYTSGYKNTFEMIGI